MILSGGGGDAPILKVGFQWLGNGSPEGPGGGGAIAGPGGAGDDAASREKLRREKADTDNLAKMKKTGMSHFRTTFGINIGIAAILKQSQIFTGTIGSLFQILGAFIDIILAADNAIIIGLIAANFVPKHRKQIILWGVAGALVFTVIFAVFATYLFKFYFISICNFYLFFN